MRHNLGSVRNDTGLFSGIRSKIAASLTLFGFLTFIVAYLALALTSVGIPVAVLWCVIHYIHNGYRW